MSCRRAVLALAGVVLLPAATLASPRYFAASGPSGHSIHGFAGGWGVQAGVELPFRAEASFLVRGDHHWLPDDAAARTGGGVIPLGSDGATVVGVAAPGNSAAKLWSVMAGFRLHPGSGVLRGYADALVGVGRLDARDAVVNAGPAPSSGEVRDDTNIALSLGAGLLVAPAGRLALFADAHYDVFGVPGVDGAVVPIRMGVRFE